MISKEEIKKQIKDNKIRLLQLDPFGYCNSRCWYCPVRYHGNPESGKVTMPLDLLEKILSNIVFERDKDDGLVSKEFNGFYTAHYNEIILYKYFPQFLSLCRKYKLNTMILSNGIALDIEKIDLIDEYKDVVNGICLNIPSFDPEVWSKRTGCNIDNFNRLIDNVICAVNCLPVYIKNKSFSIVMNGVNKNSLRENGGWINKGKLFPSDIDLDVDNGELETQFKIAQKMFPNVSIYKNPSLIDRAGLISDVIDNSCSVKMHSINKEFKMCGNSKETGGRPVGWLHINAAGEVFLCCNDYFFDYKFGDFKTQNLKDFWGSQNHIDKIYEAYNAICRSCSQAYYE